MSNPEHQLDEMVNAIQQVTNISEHKGRIQAKREAIAIITDGVNNKADDSLILQQLITWAGN